MDKKNIKKTYSNDDITVVWQPGICTHSTKCWKGLISVFNPKERPWVKMDGASSERIMEQIDQCPSGALSYIKKKEELQFEAVQAEAKTKIECSPNGPLLVYGELAIKLPDGSEESKLKVTAFCRCGASANKPYCDGAHRTVNFEG
ncbi:MAG: (4Fe-4S)-binding protein [Flammeovirgaceae bacterium]